MTAALPYATPDTPAARPRPWLPAAAAAALAILLYAHTLPGDFIYDDTFQALRDPRLADLRQWKKYFTEGYFPNAADNLWRPLVSLSYAIQHQLHGPEPFGFHLVNLLLHAAASALVAEFARRLTSVKAALIAGLLFAAHPVHVEAVAYIVGRAESACLIGMLAALILATRPLTTPRAWAIVACTFAAIFSKEQGLLIPPMLLAVIWLRRSQGQWSPDEKKPARLLAAVLTIALAAYITYRNQILPWYWETTLLDYAVQPLIRADLAARILIPVALLGRYTALLIAPVKLTPEYGLAVLTHEQSPQDPYLWLGFATLVALAAATIIALRRRHRTTLLLLFCTALTYLMVSNAMLIGTIFGERLIYIPSAFILILIGSVVVQPSRLLFESGETPAPQTERRGQTPPRVLWPLLVIVLILYGLRTFTYAAHWRDRLAFYEYAAANNPRAVRLHVLLARELLAQGKLDRARDIVEKGLAVSKEDWRLWIAAAQVAIAQNRLDDARRAIKQAWNKDPAIGDVLLLEQQLEDRRPATRPNTQP